MACCNEKMERKYGAFAATRFIPFYFIDMRIQMEHWLDCVLVRTTDKQHKNELEISLILLFPVPSTFRSLAPAGDKSNRECAGEHPTRGTCVAPTNVNVRMSA